MKNFSTWLKVIKKYVNIKVFAIVTIEYIFYFSLVHFFVTRGVILSLLISYVLISSRLFVQLFYYYKRLLESDQYNLILLKPIDPPLGLLVYNHNPADVFIILPILIYIKIKNYKK